MRMAVAPIQITDGIMRSPGPVCQGLLLVGPHLAFVSSFPHKMIAIACPCNAPFACLYSGGTALLASISRRFSTPLAESSSDVRHLP